jgi:hypothetical protein
LSRRTIEFISVFPKGVREKVYDEVLNPKAHEKLIESYMNREDVYEVPFEEIEIQDVNLKSIESAIVNLLE